MRIKKLTFSVLLAVPLSSLAVDLDQQSNEQNGSQTTTSTAQAKNVVVVSGSGLYDARRDDTASKIIVTREEIAKYGDANVAEIVKRLPGVTLAGPQGQGGEIRMRGLGSGYTQILLNGDPVPAGFALDSIQPDLIERIEVMRVGTADISAQAIAGALNIVLRKTVGTAQKEIKYAVGKQNGKYDTSLNGRVADKRGPLAYSISGGVARGMFSYPSFNNALEVTRTGEQIESRSTREENLGAFKNLQLAPRATLVLGDRDTLAAQIFLNIRHFLGDDNQFSDGIDFGAPYSRVDKDHNRSRRTSSRDTLTWTHTLPNQGKFETTLGYDYVRRIEEIDWNSIFFTSSFGLERLTHSRYNDEGVTSTGKYQTRVAEAHSVTIGWDVGNSDRDEFHRDHQMSSGPAGNFLQEQLFSANILRAAAFAQDEWKMSANWSLYLGLRYESLRMNARGNDFSPVSNRFGVWSPIVQSLWKIPGYKNDQVRVALAHTYKAPEIFRLTPRRYISYLNGPTKPDTMGNPYLKPELSWGIDSSIEHYISGGGLLSANLYYRKISDVTVTQVQLGEGRWVAAPSNQGKAVTRGVELEAKLPLRSLYDAALPIEFRSNLSINRSRVDSIPGPNNRLDSQTPLSTNIGFDYKRAGTLAAFGGNFNYQSGGPVRISEFEQRNSTPKRVLELYGLWNFRGKTSLRVTASNLLHQDNVALRRFEQSEEVFLQTTHNQSNVSLRALLEIKI